MRRIVIAKLLVLAVWALYLGIVLGRPDGSRSKIATAGARAGDKGACVTLGGWIARDEVGPPRALSRSNGESFFSGRSRSPTPPGHIIIARRDSRTD